MKKIITTILAATFGLALFAPVVFAGGFNDGPQDLPTVRVVNQTQNPCSGGPGASCWLTSVDARAGDTISVAIYYHNTTNQTAPNVSIGLGPKTSSAANSHTIRGGVAVNGMVVAEGSASVVLSSSQTLTFIPGSVRWYPSQTVNTPRTLLASENSIFTTAGLPIGDITSGWSMQGSVVASFKVGQDDTTTGDRQCTINSFTADDTSIDDGDSTVLRWNTTNCDYVTLTDISGNLDPDDTRTVRPSSDRTYTLRAYDFNGNLDDTDTVTIRVDNNNTNDTCDIDSFSASPSTIARGNSATLRWYTSGDVDYVTISGLSGDRSSDGSVTVSPYSTTTYTLRAYCNNGYTRTDSETVYVNNTDTSSAPQAITTVATVLGGTQARLNGIAVANTTSNTTAWFEWGVSGTFGNRTSSQAITNGANSQYYSELIGGLVPGVRYYYRAVVQNQNGIAYGDTVSFQTIKSSSPVVVTPSTPVVQSTTVVAQSAPSLLELRVESTYDRMCINGQMDYTITYKNVSSQTLEKSVLRFTHPKEITYLTASRGNYEVVDRTMTISLGDIKPGETGIITVRARVNDTAIAGNLTVATASVVYTNTKTRAQEDAIAYSLITVSNDCPNLLGASVFGFGSFLPSTLLGWLLLILVILALIVLARNIYRKKE